MPRFLRPSERWPQPKNWLQELHEAGFSIVQASLLERTWTQLSTVRSCFIEAPTPSCYAFARVDHLTALNPNWGLIIADDKSNKSKALGSIPHVISSHPEALLDWTLKQLDTGEWGGPSHPLPPGVQAENNVVIGPESEIEAGTYLESGVRIGARVKIGKNCRIGAHCRIADDSILGDDCQLTSHVSIGGSGFGFVQYPGEDFRRPRVHAGRVRIGSHVRLGAFVAVDRGVFEDTLVGDGCALDNIVQVAHNCNIGAHGVLCSFVGLSGSTEIGDRVVIAGMTGTKDHVKIGHNVTIAAQSGVSHNIADGQTVKGYPPRSLAEALKLQVLVGRLPELFQRVKKLEDPS